MATHDFEDSVKKNENKKYSFRKELTQESGRLVSQLSAFKGKYDEVYALASIPEKADLDVVFAAFQADVTASIGL